MNPFHLKRTNSVFLRSPMTIPGCLRYILLVLLFFSTFSTGMAQTSSIDSTVISRSDLEGIINRTGTTVQQGSMTIEKEEVVQGPLVVLNGTSFVSGQVNGDLVVINGSASLQREALVTGDLLVVGGHIYTSSRATVQGQKRLTDERYIVSRTRAGQLRLRYDRPSAMKLSIQPDGWRFNRVRGHDVDLSLRLTPNRTVWYPSFTGTVAIPSVVNNHGYLDFKAAIEEPLFEHRTLRLKFEGYKTTETNDNWHMPAFFNGLAAFFTQNDFFNYHLKRGITASAQQRIHEALTLGFAYHHDNYKNLGTNDPFTLFGGNRAFRPNPDIDTGDIRSFTWSAVLDTKHAENEGNAWHMEAEIERAVTSFGGDFKYTRYDVTVHRKNQWRGHHFDLRGKIAGSGAPLPLQKTYVLGAYSGLRGFGDFEFAGDRLLVVNAEYRLPVASFRREALISWQLELMTFFDTGTAFFSKKSGRNTPGNPVLQARVNPNVKQSLPDSYTDLNSNVGAGIAIYSRLLYASVQVAQNLNDTSVKPRFLFFLHRDLF